MVGIVLASHGEFCEGLKNSVEMISGVIKQCRTVPLRLGADPDTYGKALESAIDAVDTGSGVLVCVDLRGGTPFNRALMACRTRNIQVLVGTNLPAVLVSVLSRSEDTTLDELAQTVLQDGKDAIDIIKL